MTNGGSTAMTPSISSTELNYLVFRYLQESGFTHSAFTLGYEARLNQCNIDGHMVPAGALVRFLQKGLQYFEMEANLSNINEGEECFSLLQPMELITKDIHELQQLMIERKKNQLKERDRDKDIDKLPEIERTQVREKARREQEKEHEKVKKRLEKHKENEQQHEEPRNREVVAHQDSKANGKYVRNGKSGGKHILLENTD